MKLYKHYKGGLYEFIGLATHTETGEVLVCYQSQNDKRMWIRPVEMFMGKVTVDGKEVLRFAEIN